MKRLIPQTTSALATTEAAVFCNSSSTGATGSDNVLCDIAGEVGKLIAAAGGSLDITVDVPAACTKPLALMSTLVLLDDSSVFSLPQADALRSILGGAGPLLIVLLEFQLGSVAALYGFACTVNANTTTRSTPGPFASGATANAGRRPGRKANIRNSVIANPVYHPAPVQSHCARARRFDNKAELPLWLNCSARPKSEARPAISSARFGGTICCHCYLMQHGRQILQRCLMGQTPAIWPFITANNAEPSLLIEQCLQRDESSRVDRAPRHRLHCI